MKVQELIQHLEKLDQTLDILCYIEDDDVIPSNILDIVSICTGEGKQKRRGEDGIASIKFEKSETSKKFAFIEITADF